MNILKGDAVKSRIGRWTTALSTLAVVVLPLLGHANGIVSIAYDGEGCPQGTVRQRIASDLTKVTLTFDEFMAFAGADVPASEASKNCRIDVTMQTNESVALATRTHGYAELERGVAGGPGHFVPQGRQSNYGMVLDIPTAGTYLFSSAATVFAQGNPSGNTFSITLSSDLDNAFNRSGKGMMTVDSFELKLVP